MVSILLLLLLLFLININPHLYPPQMIVITITKTIAIAMTVTGRADMINFDKRKKASTVIKEIQQYQQAPYNFHEERTIHDFLNCIEGLTEKALYKYSLICEPRSVLFPHSLRCIYKYICISIYILSM